MQSLFLWGYTQKIILGISIVFVNLFIAETQSTPSNHDFSSVAETPTDENYSAAALQNNLA